MNRPNLQLGRLVVQLALVTALLAGCAGQQLHQDGMALIQQGRIEEGLNKLSDATKAAPDNLSYRKDLLSSREAAVNRMLLAASSERAAGHGGAAQAIYENILRIDPDNSRARLGIEVLAMDKRHNAAVAVAENLLRKGDVEGAASTLKPVLLENPKNSNAMLLQREIEEKQVKEQLVEPTLNAKFTKPVTLQFRDANLKMVFEALSRTSGINILLDKDVRPDLKTSIFVKDASVEDTIELILLQNQLDKKVISDNTVFIYPNTPAKLKDYQDLKIRSFHLTHADPKQILTMIKTLLKTKDIFIHEQTNSIVMRDTPEAIRLAEKLVADQDVEAPEVMLEVEVLEVTRTSLSQLGIAWPDTFALSTPSTVQTLGDLKHLNANTLVASPLSATLKLHLDEGDTRVLASPRIRVRNREKAKIMVGSRVPVITNTVTPVSTGTPVVTGSVQYLDVGLKLEVEPDVLLNSEVVIKLGMDVSSIVNTITGPEGSVAYEIGTRNANTVLRLKDGETQILGGLIDDEDRKSANEVPILGQIPILGYLFSSHTNDKSKTEIVLSITPHIVGSSHLPDASNEEYWAGSESNLRSTLFNIKSMGSISVATTGPATPAGPGFRGRQMIPATRNPQAGAGASTQNVQANEPMGLSWQGPTQVKSGDTINVTLSGQAVQTMNSLGLMVTFDPGVFKALDATEGTLFRQNNKQSSFTRTIDQDGGQIQVDVSSTGSEGASGTGSIVTLKLQAIAANPQSQIAVGRIAPVGPAGAALPVNAPEPFGISVGP
ncbi:MAG: secretin N-terminal domain-containing protein [Thiobacillaceae bacterium]